MDVPQTRVVFHNVVSAQSIQIKRSVGPAGRVRCHCDVEERDRDGLVLVDSHAHGIREMRYSWSLVSANHLHALFRVDGKVAHHTLGDVPS